MKKQLLSILLCLIMVVGLLPTAALAEEAAPVFNLATDLEDITIPDNLVTCTCNKDRRKQELRQTAKRLFRYCGQEGGWCLDGYYQC